MTLYLTADDVAAVFTMPIAVDAMRRLCVNEAAGKTRSADRIHIPLSEGFFRILPGVLEEDGVLGYKEFHSGSDGMRYTVHLFDLETGTPLAAMDASNITTKRTGAMGAVALEHLVKPRARKVAFIGSGKEALSALEGLRVVHPHLTEGWNFSPNPASRDAFAANASAHGMKLEPVESAVDAIAGADVVIVATNTRGKVGFEGKWLRPGLHVSSIASTAPEQREIDPDTWRVADRIVIDTHRLLEESGDAIAAHAEGALDENKVSVLADVVAAGQKGAGDADELTMYKSVGTGLQDVASALAIYEAARAQGLGREGDRYDYPVHFRSTGAAAP